MSNGDDKTTKPIDLYNIQFEDPTITEPDDLQDLLQSLQPPGYTAPVVTDYKPKIQLTDSLLRNRRTNAIDSAPRLTEAFPGFSVEPEYVENNLQSDSKNWWNTLYAQIDQIQLSKFKGRKLMHETRIDELEEELNTSIKLSPEDIDKYQREISRLKSEVRELDTDIQDEEDELSGEAISDYYKEATAAQQAEESSNWWSYLGSGEAAQDIGGSMSEAMSMAKAIVGPQLIRQVGLRLGAAYATTNAANVNPWIAAGSTVAGIGYGLYETWNMRDAESNAEAWDAYETRVKQDIALWESRNNTKAGRKQIDIIKKDAAKGVREVYQQNMLLGLGDVVQVGAAIMTPWGKLARNLLGTSKTSKILGYGVGMGFQGAIEGNEEGYQFLTKQDYLEGKYDKGKAGGTYGFGSTFDVGFFNRVGRGVDLGLETGQAMMGMLSSDYVGGRTNNPEFRNSVRAGSILGAGMGATIELGHDILRKGYSAGLNTAYDQVNKKHVKNVIDSYGREEQVLYRAGSYYDMFSKGKTSEDIKQIIDKLPDNRFVGGMTKEEAVADLTTMKSIYDRLQQPSYKNLSIDEKKVIMATMMKSKDKAKNARNVAAQTENEIQAVYEADSGINRAEGFREINRFNNQRRALEKLEKNIKSILKDKKKAVNPKRVNERILRDTLEQIEKKKDELRAKGSDIVEGFKGKKTTFPQDDLLTDLESKRQSAEMESERHNNYYTEMEGLTGENIKYFEPYAEELKSFVNRKREGQKKQEKAEEYKSKIKDPNSTLNENDLVWYKGNEGTIVKRNSDNTLDVKINATGIIETIPENQLEKLITLEGAKDNISETRKKVEAGGLFAEQDLNQEGGIISDDILENALSLAEVLEGSHKGKYEGSKRQGAVVGSHKNAQTKGKNPENYENTGDEVTAEKFQEDAKEQIDRLNKEARTRFVFLKRIPGSSGYQSMEPQTTYFLSQTPEKEIIENHDVLYRINKAGFTGNLKQVLGENVFNMFKNPRVLNKGVAKELNMTLEELTDKIINLPVEIVLVNKKTGEIVKSRTETRNTEREVKGVLYDESRVQIRNKKTRNNLLALKTSIYNIIANKQTPIGSVEDIYGYQQIRYGETQNDPRQVFKDTLGRVAIGDKNEAALRENKNSNEFIHPHFKWQDKFNGWVFLEIIRPNSVTPIKANNRNINKNEAKIILNIYKAFLNKTASPKSLYGQSGLTYGQMLNLLVYEGPGASTSVVDNKLYVDLQTKRIHFGNNKTPKGEIDIYSEEEFINHVMKHKKRRIDLQYTNRSIFSGELEALEKINFLNTEIIKGVNDDYNTILMDQGVITVNTNIQTNPFTDPNIFLSQEVNAKEVIKKDKPDFGNEDMGMFSEVTPETLGSPIIDEAEARAYWEARTDMPLQFINDFIKIGNEKGGLAQGVFQATGVKLSRKAATGVEYHELYHSVEETMLTNEEIKSLDNETIQIVGIPTESDINKYRVRYADKVNLKAVNELGFKTKEDLYRHLVLAEHRANNYQNYAASDGKVKFGKQETNFFRRLWNWIKNIFNKPKLSVNSLFNNIHQGYYKGVNPIPERVKALVDSGIVSYSEIAETVFKEEEINDITMSLLRHSIDSAGGLKTLLESDKITVNLEDTFKNIEKQVEDNADQKWLSKILQHKEFFMEELRAHLLFINAEDTTITDEELETAEEGNTEILTATRPSYEISNRDKARPAVKLLVLLAPELKSIKIKEGGYDAEISKYTGLVKPVNATNMFSILENELADTVSDYIGNNYVTSEKQIMEKLENLQSTDPSFKYIFDAVNKIPGLKTKFHSAFNLRSMNFLNVNYKGKTGVVKFRIYDPGEFSRRAKVTEEWLNNFQDKSFEDSNNILELIKNWKTSRVNTKENKGLKERFIMADNILNESLGKEISGHLANLGIIINTKELKDAYKSLNGKDDLQKFMKLISGINKLFNGSGYSLYKISKGKEFDYIDNNLIKDEKIIRTLANSKAKFMNHYGESVIRSTGNKSHWLFAPYNYMTNIVRVIKNGDLNNNKHLKDLLASPFNRTSRFLNALKDDSNTKVNLEVKTLGALRGNEAAGQSFRNLKKLDELAMRMSLELNGFTLPMTYASKSVYQLLKGLPKIELGASFKWEFVNPSIPDGIKGMFADKILAEYNRITQVAEHISGSLPIEDMIVDYHYSIDKEGNKDFSKAKGLKFLNFPTLNSNKELRPLFFNTDNTLVKTLDKDTGKKLYNYIEKILQNRINDQLTDAITVGLIKKTNEGFINQAIDLNILKRYEKKYGDSRTDAIKRAIAEYSVNGMMNNLEMQHMFLGDPAFYKGASIEKRPPSLLATGDIVGEIKDEYGNPKTHYTAAVINDIIKISDIHPQLGRILSSDGNAYITAEHYKDIVTGLEGWSKDKEEAHQRLIKGIGKAKDMKNLIAQPIKGMHYQLRNWKGMSIPTYFKYSQVPLYPQLTEGTKLDVLRVAMEDKMNPIDVIVHMSAVKSGAQNPINILNEDNSIKQSNILSAELTPMRLEFRHWKLQQKSPIKTGDQLIGSQPKKQMIGALEVLNPDKPRHREIAQELNDIYIAQSNLQTNQLKTKYGINLVSQGNENNTYTFDNLAEFVKNIGENISRTTNISRHLRKDLEVIDNEFVTEISATPLRRKIQQIAASMFTKAATKIKGPGGGKILINASLYENVTKYSELDPVEQQMLKKSAIVNTEDLKPTYVKNNKVIPGHVWLPHWMGKLIPTNKMSLTEVKQYLEDSRLREFIAYRIPTQFLSSIDLLQVVGFLPESMGNSIIAYNEMVPKTGHDFDFDKLYTILPYFEYNKSTEKIEYVEYDSSKPAGENSKKALHNRMIELYSEILSDVEVHKNSMKPIETLDDRYYAARIRAKQSKTLTTGEKAALTKLKVNKDEYINKVNDILSAKKDLEWASPLYQMNLKRIFQVGQFGIGQMARHTSDHGISGYNTLDEVFGVDSISIGHENNVLGITDLRQMKDVEGNIIADSLSSQVNINVDIEADPETAQGLNLSPATNNHRALLIRAGAPREWVAYFMSQPILVDLVKTMDNNEGNLSEKQYDKEGLISAQETVLKLYAEKTGHSYNKKDNEILDPNGKKIPSLIDTNDVTKVISKQKLYDMLGTSYQNGKEQLQILQYFRDITPHAKSLNNQINAAQADVQGTGGSIASSIVMVDQMKNALEDSNLFGIEGKMKGTAVETYTENAPKLFVDSMEGVFFESSNAFMGALRIFANQSGRTLSDFSPETINLIIDHLYASIYMSIDGSSKSDLKNMFFSDNSVANKLWSYKYGKNKLKDSAIVDFLTPVRSKKGSLGYIKGNTSAIKSALLNDKIVNSWDKRTEEFFTKELPRYALYSTAWRTNLFSFHELTPKDTALRTKINEEFKKLKNPDNKIEENKLGLDNPEYFGNIINQVYKHLHHNKILVPNIRKGDIIKKSLRKEKNIVTEFKTNSTKFKLEESTDMMDARYKPFVTYENNLYEFKAVDEKNNDIGVYEITNKLGLRNEKNQYIYEYSKTESKSFIESNNVDNILKDALLEEQSFELIEEEFETFDGEIYDSKKDDELDTNIECP